MKRLFSKRLFSKYLALSLISGLLLATAACGGDDAGGSHDELDPEADGCEHMIEGPNQEVTAIGDMAADAPDTGEHHIRWNIALVDDGSGTFNGYVDLVVEEAGEGIFFLDHDIPMTIWDAAGDEVPLLRADDSITACTEVDASNTYELGVGTYLLGFGPTTQPSVSVVVIPAGEQ
jgi:hypothetical protein